MKTFMFPGQGSQSKGMGGALFDEFKELTEKADKILGYSIKELCLEDPRKELGQTQFTQPALYTVNALSYLKEVEESGQKPGYVAGHSLGEFNALFAAECFDFEAGLKLVKKRGELMSQATDGAMAAIINGTKEDIERILEENGLTNIDLANFNSPSQIVISGATDEIAKAQSCFTEGKMLYYPLNTSGSFHSRFMQPAKEKFQSYLKRFKLNDLKIPVIANVTAKPYKNKEIFANLTNQITGAVRWTESVQYLIEQGSADEPMLFKEIGHGNVLTKLVDKIKKETPDSSAKATSKKEKKVKEKPGASKKANAQKKKETKEAPVSNKTANSENTKPANFINAEEKVKAWNSKYPVGTKVKSLLMDYDNLETRTEAVVLFGHRAAVYMKEYNGYFDLDEVAPL